MNKDILKLIKVIVVVFLLGACGFFYMKLFDMEDEEIINVAENTGKHSLLLTSLLGVIFITICVLIIL